MRTMLYSLLVNFVKKLKKNPHQSGICSHNDFGYVCILRVCVYEKCIRGKKRMHGNRLTAPAKFCV